MKRILKAAGLAVMLAGMSAGAHAQITVSGITTGCFGAGCSTFLPIANFAIGTSGETLTFTGTTFSGTTNAATGGFSIGNFGSLIIAPPPTVSTPDTLFNTPFTLLFTLTAPAGASNPTTTFTVTGNVGSGSPDVSYSGGVANFTFPRGTGTISIDRGQVGTTLTNISGRVTAAVPELGTWGMMIAGFGLVGATLRRRRNVGAKVSFA